MDTFEQSLVRALNTSYCPDLPPHSHYHPATSSHFSQERLKESMERNTTAINTLRSKAAAHKQRTLLERMSSSPSTPSLPLIQRISKPLYTPAPPLPKDIKFRKTKIILREQDYWKLILATKKRLDIIDEKCNYTDVCDADDDDLEKLMNDFFQLYIHFRERTDSFTHSQWRAIKRDCKAVGSISLKSLNSNWDQVCAQLAALGRQDRFCIN